MTPPNEHTSEGGRDDRGVPYHAESTLSSAQVLKVDCVVYSNLQEKSSKRSKLHLKFIHCNCHFAVRRERVKAKVTVVARGRAVAAARTYVLRALDFYVTSRLWPGQPPGQARPQATN